MWNSTHAQTINIKSIYTWESGQLSPLTWEFSPLSRENNRETPNKQKRDHLTRSHFVNNLRVLLKLLLTFLFVHHRSCYDMIIPLQVHHWSRYKLINMKSLRHMEQKSMKFCGSDQENTKHKYRFLCSRASSHNSKVVHWTCSCT